MIAPADFIKWLIVFGVPYGGGSGGSDLAGDVTGAFLSNTVLTVGGASAASIAGAVTAVNDATTSAASGTFVKRDVLGVSGFTTLNISDLPAWSFVGTNAAKDMVAFTFAEGAGIVITQVDDVITISSPDAGGTVTGVFGTPGQIDVSPSSPNPTVSIANNPVLPGMVTFTNDLLMPVINYLTYSPKISFATDGISSNYSISADAVTFFGDATKNFTIQGFANIVAGSSILPDTTATRSIGASGNVFATAWITQVNGNALSAGTLAVSSVPGDNTYYPLLTASNGSTQSVYIKGAGLRFDSATNTLTAAIFNGALSGNAATATLAATATAATTATTATSATNSTNSTNWLTTASSTSSDFYIPFVPSSSTGQQTGFMSANLFYNPGTNTLRTSNMLVTGSTTLSSLTGTRALVINSSKIIATELYASANTGGSFVYRDGSGNFSAGTITAALSGNATTATSATTATNAVNTGVTDDTTTNATRYISFVDATSGNNPIKISSTKLTWNPSTGALGVTNIAVTTNLTLTNLTASTVVGLNASKIATSIAYASSNTGSALVIRDANGDFSMRNLSVADVTASGNIVSSTWVMQSGNTFYNNSNTPTTQQTVRTYQYAFTVTTAASTAYALDLPAGKTLANLRNITSMFYASSIPLVTMSNETNSSYFYKVYCDSTKVIAETGGSFNKAGTIYVWVTTT